MEAGGLYCLWMNGRCAKADLIGKDAYPEYWGYFLLLNIKRNGFLEMELVTARNGLEKLAGTHNYVGHGYEAGEPVPTPEQVEEQLTRDVEFLTDGVVCEWVYVLDFDQGIVEVYRGSKSGPKTDDHRFANVGNDSSTVPKLVKTFEVRSLATMGGLQFVNEIYEGIEDEEPELIELLQPYH